MSFMTPMGMFCGGQAAAAPTTTSNVANLFAISLAPANAMAATLAALPFVPDLTIDKDRVAASPWSYRSAGIGSGKTATSDSTNGTAIPTTWAGYSGTDNLVAYGLKKNSRFFNEVTFTTNASGAATFNHGLDPTVSIGLAEFKSANVVAPWRTYARGLGGAAYLLLNSNAAQAAATGWFTATSTQVSVTGLAASAGYVAYLYAHDTASDSVIQSGSAVTDSNQNATITLGWRPQFMIRKNITSASSWCFQDTTRGWGAGNDAQIYADSTAVETSAFETGAPTSTGFTLAQSGANQTWIYLAIRDVGG